MALIIKPKYEIVESKGFSVEDVKKAIEVAGRTCYRSENFIKDKSYEKFVNMLCEHGHGAMLEHGTIYLKFSMPADNTIDVHTQEYLSNPYSRVTLMGNDVYVTTNYRVLEENGWLSDLEYICEPTEFHEKRYTVRFTIQLVIEREYNRHRTHSLGSESTRYCNYNLDKFGNEITICQPDNVTDEDLKSVQCDDFWGYVRLLNDINIGKEIMDERMSAIDWWWFANLATEISYINLVKLGWKPEQARTILPLDLKCESVHTAFASDWVKFFRLRSYVTPSNKPHPDAIAMAKPLMDEFISKGYITEEDIKRL